MMAAPEKPAPPVPPLILALGTITVSAADAKLKLRKTRKK